MKLILLLYILFAFAFSFNLISSDGEKMISKEMTVAEMAGLQNLILGEIKLLDSDKWDTRQNAKKKLLSIIAKNNLIMNYFIKTTLKHKSPEVKISSKEILNDYFLKYIYDPDRKKGFIGLQLLQGRTTTIDKKIYIPILVGSPIAGLPGEKAGIKNGDMIIEVDKKKCSEKYNMQSFIDDIASKKPGDKVTLKLFSGGKIVVKKVILTERPKNQVNALPEKSKKELFEGWYARRVLELPK